MNNIAASTQQKPTNKIVMSQKQTAIVLTDLSTVDQQWLQKIKSTLNQCDLTIVDILQFGDDPNAAMSSFNANFLLLIANTIDGKVMEVLTEQMTSAVAPVIVFEKTENSEHALSFAQNLMCTYIGGDVRLERLPTILSVAFGRYESAIKLNAELADTRQQLEDRKAIARAKGMLMESKGWTEDKAYSHLRSLAMKKGKKMGEVSRLIIEASAILGE